MGDVARSLRDALEERLDLIANEESRRDMPAHVQRLRLVSERIEALQADLPRPIAPELAHYLARQSYSKALEYLRKADQTC